MGARQVFVGAGALAVSLAYVVLVAVLNGPSAAHAPRSEPRALRSVAVTATTIDRLAAAAGTVTDTSTTLPLIEPGTLHAPRVGTYAVHVTAAGSETDGTLTVRRDGEQRLAAGSFAQVSRLRWTATSAQLLRTGERGSDGSCVLTPSPMFLAAKLSEGRTWSSDSLCVSNLGPTTATIRRQETAKVTRRARAQVGGEAFDTWLIERHVITTSRDGSATLITEETSSELFAPRIGLSVYALRRIDRPRASGIVDSAVETIELRSAVPA